MRIGQTAAVAVLVAAALAGCGGDDDDSTDACGGWELCGGAEAVAWLEDNGW